MTVSDCTTVGMTGYQQLLTVVTPDTVVCVRGRHAIGKSEGVYQASANKRSEFYRDPENCRRMIDALADPTHKAVRHASGWVQEWNYEMGIPVLERRLSQMTEGDMIGLPFKTEVAGQQCTQFLACDWIIQSCHFPVMLFLDERNRALDGVKQSVFQLADSKAFYGNRLHPETQIVVAENVGEAYQVQQNDPAEISRWVTIQLEPSFEEFMNYAEGKLHPAVIEFLRTSPKSLEYIGVYEPNKKYPDRRSWTKFSFEATSLGLLDQDDPDMLLRVLAGGHLGVETGAQFYKFMQERERQVKAVDVLRDWKQVRKRLRKGGTLSNEKYVEIVHKLGDWLKSGPGENNRSLTDNQAAQMAAFMTDCPAEPRLAAWALLQRDAENVFKVHPMIEKLMVATATGEDMENVQYDDDADDDEDSAEEDVSNLLPRKRGKRR